MSIVQFSSQHIRRSAYLPLPPIWALCTSSIAETNLLKLALAIPVVFFSTSMLEALWSPREILQYLAFSCGLPGLLFLVYRIGVSMILTDSSLQPVCGCAGLIITLVVGIRHAFPLKELINLNKILPSAVHGFLPARGLVQARHVPFLCLSTEVLLGTIFPTWFPEWPLAVLAYLSSWIYIRYLMHFPYANLRGDHSTEFNFSLLFPKWSRHTIDRFGSIVYTVLSKFTNVFEIRSPDKTTLNSNISLYSPADAAAATAVMEAIGTEKAKFEERRAKALRFLDDNIATLMGRHEPVEDSLWLVESPRKIGGTLTADEIAEV